MGHGGRSTTGRLAVRGAAALLFLGGLLLVGRVRAESTVEWRTPDGCPGHARVVERIEELAPAAAIALALRPPSDAPLDWAAAATPASAEAEAVVPALEATPDPPPSPTEPAPATPGPPSTRDEGRRVKPLLRARGGAELAVFPRSTAALGLDLGARVGHGASVEAGFVGLPVATFDVGDGDKARFWLLAGGLRLCGHRAEGRMGLAACLGGEAGAVSAEGLEVDSAARRQVSWLAPSGAVMASWPLGDRARLVALAELLVPVVRHDFRYAPEAPFHALPALDGRLTAGVELGSR